MVAYEREHRGRMHSTPRYDVPNKENGCPVLDFQPHSKRRTALVPGFMAGVESAHRLGGKLPFASLFEPASMLRKREFEVGGSPCRVDRIS